MKVITRTDLGVEATPRIPDSIGQIQHLLSAKYSCPVLVDSVDYKYTPFYIDDLREDLAEVDGRDYFLPGYQIIDPQEEEAV